MKFQFKLNPNRIDANGNINAKADEVKKVVEETADKAYQFGKTEGFFLGGLFIGGLYVAIDAACEYFIGNERK